MSYQWQRSILPQKKSGPRWQHIRSPSEEGLRQEDVGFEDSLGYLKEATNLTLPNQIRDFIPP